MSSPRAELTALATKKKIDTDSRALAEALDAADEFSHLRSRFQIPRAKPSAPRDETIYLCGNSLGALPNGTKKYVTDQIDKWGELGVDGHFTDPLPWVSIDESVNKGAARLVGAKEVEVCVMNTLTVNLHLMMVSFYRPTKTKFKILVEAKAFPSDMHMLQSQVKFHGFDPEEALVKFEPREGEATLRTEDIIAKIKEHAEAGDVALVMMSGVQYYTGQRFDIKTITKAARDCQIPIGWDLAHAVGNVPLNLHDDGPDFACWCSYKYLNSGPGNIAGCFVHERHATNDKLNRFAGWWGHRKEDRFVMSHNFIPSPGAQGYMLSNPSVLCCAALRASLDVFEEAGGVLALRSKSEKLTGYLEMLLEDHLSQYINIFTPRNPADRGCQLSLTFPAGNMMEVFSKLCEAGVICDERKPDVIRVAPTPLYNSYADVWELVEQLKTILIPGYTSRSPAIGVTTWTKRHKFMGLGVGVAVIAAATMIIGKVRR